MERRRQKKSSSIEAREVLEALRCGVVNELVAKHVAYGRETTLRQVTDTIESNPDGTLQQLVGGTAPASRTVESWR